MNPTQQPILATTCVSAATLGAPHGYRFEGDSVELTASIRLKTAAAHRRSWAVQLRADGPRGHVIATAALASVASITDDTAVFTVQAEARPPADRNAHLLGLALVAADAAGQFTELHDYVEYPQPEVFVLPRFDGTAECSLIGEQVRVRVAAIENPRDAANLSGTLSLEVWALSETYAGGEFAGRPVAGAILGSLAGQSRWTELNFDLPAARPQANSRLVLMLREWNGVGYVTRDHVNLAEPFVVATPAPVAKACPVATPAVDVPAPAKAGVNINTASTAELLKVKGLTRLLVQGLVAARPFKQIEELRKVKGFGPKVWEKVRGSLRLS